jgi:D-3-phosphoglycerate dehydrogenase
MRILNTEPSRFDALARAALGQLGEVVEQEAARPYLIDNVERFDVLFVGLRNLIDREILQRATRLRCVATPTTGTDHIDVAAAEELGITVLSLSGEVKFLTTIRATAELTWGLLLALVRRIPAAHQSVLDANWTRDRFAGTELNGKTLGIVGYGRLGRMVAEYGRAFRMTCLAYDRDSTNGDGNADFVELSDLLSRSDIVSVHLPLTRETVGFFNEPRFRQMKDGALLINTARGKIVDETALLGALRSRKLSGAALDVLAGETSPDPAWLARSELRTYAHDNVNLLITPHVGGLTTESAQKANAFMIEKLATYLRTAAQREVARPMNNLES